MSEELLNLSTIVTRPTINITSKKHPDGKLYELITLADLGPYEYSIILERNAELEPLRAAKKLTAEQERRLKKMLDDVVKLLLPDIEPAVLAALTDQQKEMIIVTWSAHMSEARKAAGAEGNRRSRRTTAASSRGSKPSTAATPKLGSTRPRGR